MTRSARIEPGIVTGDGAALAGFYCDALGFTVDVVLSFPQGEVRRLRRGEARLKLYQPAQAGGEAPEGDQWPDRAGWAYAALHVADATAEVEAVRAGGGTVITEVTHHRPRACFAMIADPEGNVWELLQESPPA
jgi:predicted enzyme related to lactoylglutathione lyase